MSHGGGERPGIALWIEACIEACNPFAWAVFAGTAASGSHH